MSDAQDKNTRQEQPQGELDETPAEQLDDSSEKASLADELAAVTAERDANREHWLRTQAELENYRRRARNEADQARMYAALPLVRDLLPSLDNLRRAITAAESSHNVEELTQGVRMVLEQMESVFASHAVMPIESVGQTFDPNVHEAIQQAPSAEHPPMTVLQEVERGYMIHDRVVRPSRVVVSRSAEE